MALVGFEPAVPASERTWAHSLDVAATGIGERSVYAAKKYLKYETGTLVHSYTYTVSEMLTP
jgi:hypothetical protein